VIFQPIAQVTTKHKKKERGEERAGRRERGRRIRREKPIKSPAENCV